MPTPLYTSAPTVQPGSGAVWLDRREYEQLARMSNVKSQDTGTLVVTPGPDGPTLLARQPRVPVYATLDTATQTVTVRAVSRDALPVDPEQPTADNWPQTLAATWLYGMVPPDNEFTFSGFTTAADGNYQYWITAYCYLKRGLGHIGLQPVEQWRLGADSKYASVRNPNIINGPAMSQPAGTFMWWQAYVPQPGYRLCLPLARISISVAGGAITAVQCNPVSLDELNRVATPLGALPMEWTVSGSSVTYTLRRSLAYDTTGTAAGYAATITHTHTGSADGMYVGKLTASPYTLAAFMIANYANYSQAVDVASMACGETYYQSAVWLPTHILMLHTLPMHAPTTAATGVYTITGVSETTVMRVTNGVITEITQV